jgi:hypothetical protein
MRAARILKQRFASLFRRQRAETELNRELSLHLEQLTKQNIARGMSESEARREAPANSGPLRSFRRHAATCAASPGSRISGVTCCTLCAN